jgi:hypothetical protein
MNQPTMMKKRKTTSLSFHQQQPNNTNTAAATTTTTTNRSTRTAKDKPTTPTLFPTSHDSKTTHSTTTADNDSSCHYYHYHYYTHNDPIAAAKHAQQFPWKHRPRPKVFDPIHVRLGRESPPAKACSCFDWWNTRSTFLCCLYPLLRRWSRHSVMDVMSQKIISSSSSSSSRGDSCSDADAGTDTDAGTAVDGVLDTGEKEDEIISMWKRQIVDHPLNVNCPESMRGLWWLQWDHAPENLVTIFSDCEWIGMLNENDNNATITTNNNNHHHHHDDDNDDDDNVDMNINDLQGYGMWTRRLKYNWSRDDSCLGLVFAIWAANRSESRFWGRMNLKDGICTVHGKRGEGIQVVYRVTEDEWWKVHYGGNPVRTYMILLAQVAQECVSGMDVMSICFVFCFFFIFRLIHHDLHYLPG